jgi:SAM-dependent methyltransferase
VLDHLFLRGTYFPAHADNRMQFEGEVELARARYLAEQPATLTRLLRQRYAWMRPYLANRTQVVELGSGAGFAKQFLPDVPILLTDVGHYPWIDLEVNAMQPPFAPASIDAFICSHMIHHLYSPRQFLDIVHEQLRPGGLLVIQEVHTGLMLRILLRLMRHEGWSFDVDVFDRNAVANDPSDPWSANCAIPRLLFDDHARFAREVPGFHIVHDALSETLLFPLSGGVIAQTWRPALPAFLLDLVEWLDRGLVALAPNVCAMGRSLVLQKVG